MKAPLQRLWRRARGSRAGTNAVASVLAFASSTACGLLTIPLAVRYLDKPEMGLWTVVNQVVSYLLWMDLGVGQAVGRKMADAVIHRDQPEINAWWTTVRLVLGVQSALVLVLGLATVPWVLKWFKVPAAMQADGWFLCAGAVLVAAWNIGLRGYPGVLTAQERFHWLPLAQALNAWLNLATFAVMLKAGFGVRSYVFAAGIVQLASWCLFLWSIRTGPHRLGWNREGVTRERFRALFGFSLNLSAVGLVGTVINSLPALILARVGGLAQVPAYMFTARGPLLATSLVGRTQQAFYPALQRLHVTGDAAGFGRKFRDTGLLCVGVAAMACGAALAGNRVLVQWLAGREFFAGAETNVWFAAGIVTVPLSAVLQSLFQIAGNMRSSALVSIGKLLLGGVCAVFAFRAWGVAGLAAVFALLPLLDGVYAYCAGARSCGHGPRALCGPLGFAGIAVIVATVVAGILAGRAGETEAQFRLFGRDWPMPVWPEWLAGGSLVLCGLVLTLRQLRALGRRAG